MELWLSCYLVLLSVDSKTRQQDSHSFLTWLIYNFMYKQINNISNRASNNDFNSEDIFMFHWILRLFPVTDEQPRWCPGPWFNIKMWSYQYRKSHCGDKTIVRSSYLHNEMSYSVSSRLYIGPAFVKLIWQQIQNPHMTTKRNCFPLWSFQIDFLLPAICIRD